MFGFGMPEMILLLIIALVVVGPGKIPQLGQALGSSIRNFKKASSGDDVVQLNDKEERKPQEAPPRSGFEVSAVMLLRVLQP